MGESGEPSVECPGGNIFFGNRVMHVWRAWYRMNAQIIYVCDQTLKQRTRVDLVDLYSLVALAEAPEQILRMSELAQAVGFSAPRMTYRVNKLVDRGFVVRCASDTDARAQQVRLTPDGAAELWRAAALHEEQINTIFHNTFTDTELDSLIEDTARIRVTLPHRS